jgi:D-alanyl-D-alanine carboxypeptidase/D-alanyl-D-alanine carboxypeptidase (penicillin-binding protein 5/6)
LDDEEHYTTARELAIIARAALCHPLITTIVSTRKTTIPHVGIDSVRLLVNHNKLLRMYDGCIGVKTGFTKRSGRCLVSAAERDGVRLIAVTLNAPDDWQDHTALLDYGFSQYRAVTLCCAGDFSYALPVVNASNDVVCVRNTEALTLPLPNHRSSITVTVELPRFCYAPLTANEAVGRVVFHCDTDGDGTPEVIGTVALRTTEERPQKKQRRRFWQWLCDLFRRK